MRYRILKDHEVIKKGDQYLDWMERWEECGETIGHTVRGAKKLWKCIELKKVRRPLKSRKPRNGKK